MLLTEGKHFISKHFKHPELLGRSTSVNVDPFNPSDYGYLLSAFLGGPGHFDPDKLETILKKLLQDDYEKYYQTARYNIALTGQEIKKGKQQIKVGKSTVPTQSQSSKQRPWNVSRLTTPTIAGVGILWWLGFLGFWVAMYLLYHYVIRYW